MSTFNHASTKAVIVTDTNGINSRAEETKHVGADSFRFSNIERGALDILCDGKIVALYAPRSWDSVTIVDSNE